MCKVIDAPSDLSAYAEDLAREGVRTVIRYYNHTNSRKLPAKRLETSEALALHRAGLSLMVVFQQRGGAEGNIQDLNRAKGEADARRAIELAAHLGQPQGSAIYFAVDHDYFRRSEIDEILPYFEAVRNALGTDYRVGVYGSGTVGGQIVSNGFADLIWLAGAVGWSGTIDMLRSDRWALFQKYLHKTWPGGGFGYDGNIVSPAFTDFGQFNLDATPVAEVRHSINLMEVTARSGLKLRKGPGEGYDDIRLLPLGTIVTALSETGGWIQVDIEGDGSADGYMFGGYLKAVAGGFPSPDNNETPLAVARAELARGVREIAGSSDNPRIVMYHGTTHGGRAPDETAWCSSFVNYCVEQAGYVGTNSKWAMSWHDSNWGTTVTSDPREGDLAVFKRRKGSSRGEVSGGHVGFLLEDTGDQIRLLGGNQGNAVSIKNYPKDGVLEGAHTHYKLLSIRRP